MQSSHDRTPTRTALLAGIVPVLFGLNGAMAAETQVFDNPTVDGITVDRCLSWDRTCDWPAAHEFCARVGYIRALDWTWAWKGVTKTLGSLETCTTDEETVCGGFLEITCARGPDVAPPQPPVEPEPFVEPEPTDDLGANDATPAPPAPPAAPAVFPGALQDYSIEEDPAGGGWIVTNITPAAPGGAVVVDAETDLVFFADGSIPGPAAGSIPGPSLIDRTGNELSGPLDDAELEESMAADAPEMEAGADADIPGSGVLVARLEEGAHDCYQTGPSPTRLYTRCEITYSLTNTSTEEIFWTSGEWETPEEDGDGMDRRGVGYQTKTLLPGKKRTLNSFCIVPTGQGTGTWAAWGSAQYYGSGDRNQFTWRLAAICP